MQQPVGSWGALRFTMNIIWECLPNSLGWSASPYGKWCYPVLVIRWRPCTQLSLVHAHTHTHIHVCTQWWLTQNLEIYTPHYMTLWDLPSTDQRIQSGEWERVDSHQTSTSLSCFLTETYLYLSRKILSKFYLSQASQQLGCLTKHKSKWLGRITDI